MRHIHDQFVATFLLHAIRLNKRQLEARLIFVGKCWPGICSSQYALHGTSCGEQMLKMSVILSVYGQDDKNGSFYSSVSCYVGILNGLCSVASSLW